jgi:tRNA threonylcarbamoyladenosine biosynthesis protein TsaB
VSNPWLVLDTATPIATVGVWSAAGVLAEYRLSETRRHAEGLVDAVDRALLAAGVGLDEIGGVGVGRGPGSFIGVRTGIATAKGICLGRGIPLVGIPTLVALAASAELPEGRGLAVVDAKRGEVYAQLVEKGTRILAVEAPVALSPEEAEKRARGLAFVVGTGLESLAGGAEPGPTYLPLTAPSAAGLGAVLAALIQSGIVDELDSLVPEYSRPPDAKLPAVDPGARRDLAGG